MALTTPVQFGRALNFGRPNPLPMWNKSTVSETAFPNALGLVQIYYGEQVVVPTYGYPFIDAISNIRNIVALYAPIDTDIALEALIFDDIHRFALAASKQQAPNAGNFWDASFWVDNFWVSSFWSELIAVLDSSNLDREAIIFDMIERRAKLPSTRITRSIKNG